MTNMKIEKRSCSFGNIPRKIWGARQSCIPPHIQFSSLTYSFSEVQGPALFQAANNKDFWYIEPCQIHILSFNNKISSSLSFKSMMDLMPSTAFLNYHNRCFQFTVTFSPVFVINNNEEMAHIKLDNLTNHYVKQEKNVKFSMHMTLLDILWTF